MKMQLGCLPCSLRQALEAAQNATSDTEVQACIMDECMDLLKNYRNYASSPAMARDIHAIVRRHTGISDPYAVSKKATIDAALGEYEAIRALIKEKGDIYRALKVSAAGNNIDMAVYSNVDVASAVKSCFDEDFTVCDIDIFKEQLSSAKTLLLIGDNAGESVFDRAFIESLPPMDIFYAVKSAPIINDVTERDAIDSGLCDVSRVISTGCNVPGTILSECSKEFLDIFHSADIVISKGQGNFETLENADRGVFFLLRAKCRLVADAFAVPLGSYIFKYLEV